MINPQEKITVIDNFIPPEMCERIVSAYNVNKKEVLSVESDNLLHIDNIANLNFNEFEYIRNILKLVLKLTNEKYDVNLHLDFAGLFSRIIGNKCELHCDNLKLSCPKHGDNQENLRNIKCTCPEAKYVENHTPWRTHTALLYLDSNHEGGDIVFQDGPYSKIYKRVITATAGKLVVTPNNQYFYHETTPITKGIRYAMFIWMTDNLKWKSHLI